MRRIGRILNNPTGDGLRALLSAFLCFFLLFSLFATYSYFQAVARENAAYDLQMHSATARMADSLGLTIFSARNACNAVFSQRWYEHYRNAAGIYDEEFNMLHRSEISNSLATLASAHPFITDILVITPALDSVIAVGGWKTVANYQRIYDRIHVDDLGDWTQYPHITAAQSAYFVITLPDFNIRHQKSVLALILNKRLFAAQVEALISEDMAAVSITLEEKPLFAWEGEGAGGETYQHRAAQVDLTARVRAKPLDSMIAPLRTAYLLTLALAFIISLVLAQVTAWINFAPLHRLIARLTGAKQELDLSPHSFLTEYITAVSQSNRSLSDENITLHESIDRFLSAKKNEILLGMLLRPNFEYDDPFVKAVLPWLGQKRPLWLVLMQPQEESLEVDEPALSTLAQYAMHFVPLKLFTGGACLLFCFDSREGAKSAMPGITQRLKALYNNSFFLVASDVIDTPDAICPAYLALQAKLEEVRRTLTYLPLAEQTQFVIHLQSCKLDECLEQLKEARTRHSPDAYLLLLTRIAAEYRMDIAESTRGYGNQRRVASLAGEWNVPILFAICVTEIRHTGVRCVVQTVSYLPHFISVVVLVGMLHNMLSTNTGIVNNLIAMAGAERINFIMSPRWFRTLHVGSGVWQGFGYGSIIYIAAIFGIDPSLYEAAKMDGISKFQEVYYITLPMISQTIIILFIMRLGGLMSVGFEKVFLLYNTAVYETGDTIATYLYRKGIESSNYSYATAIGLFNSLVNFTFVIAANGLCRKLADASLW